MIIQQAYVGLTQQDEHALINEDGDILGALNLINDGLALQFTLAADVVRDGGIVIMGGSFDADKARIDGVTVGTYYDIVPSFICDVSDSSDLLKPIVQCQELTEDQDDFLIFAHDEDDTIWTVDINGNIRTKFVNLQPFIYAIGGSIQNPVLNADEMRNIVGYLMGNKYIQCGLETELTPSFSGNIGGHIDVV